jgi:uncharacterized Tic20 family protein
VKSENKIKKMRKFINLVVLSLTLLISVTTASYAGPFLFWGVENLNNQKIPTLQGKFLLNHKIEKN